MKFQFSVFSLIKVCTWNTFFLFSLISCSNLTLNTQKVAIKIKEKKIQIGGVWKKEWKWNSWNSLKFYPCQFIAWFFASNIIAMADNFSIFYPSSLCIKSLNSIWPMSRYKASDYLLSSSPDKADCLLYHFIHFHLLWRSRFSFFFKLIFFWIFAFFLPPITVAQLRSFFFSSAFLL